MSESIQGLTWWQTATQHVLLSRHSYFR